MTDDRLKIWLNFWKVIIPAVVVSGAAGLAGQLINADYQQRQLDNEKVLQDTKLKMEEIAQTAQIKSQTIEQERQYLTEFLNFALDDNIERRFRFAQYFAALTHSEVYKDGWSIYFAQIAKERRQAQEALAEKERRLEAVVSEQERAVLTKDIERLKTDLTTLPASLEAAAESKIAFEKAAKELDAADAEVAEKEEAAKTAREKAERDDASAADKTAVKTADEDLVMAMRQRDNKLALLSVIAVAGTRTSASASAVVGARKSRADLKTLWTTLDARKEEAMALAAIAGLCGRATPSEEQKAACAALIKSMAEKD